MDLIFHLMRVRGAKVIGAAQYQSGWLAAHRTADTDCTLQLASSLKQSKQHHH